eukprot:3325749-Rhodomonas_salina.2
MLRCQKCCGCTLQLQACSGGARGTLSMEGTASRQALRSDRERSRGKWGGGQGRERWGWEEGRVKSKQGGSDGGSDGEREEGGSDGGRRNGKGRKEGSRARGRTGDSESVPHKPEPGGCGDGGRVRRFAILGQRGSRDVSRRRPHLETQGLVEIHCRVES